MIKKKLITLFSNVFPPVWSWLCAYWAFDNWMHGRYQTMTMFSLSGLYVLVYHWKKDVKEKYD